MLGANSFTTPQQFRPQRGDYTLQCKSFAGNGMECHSMEAHGLTAPAIATRISRSNADAELPISQVHRLEGLAIRRLSTRGWGAVRTRGGAKSDRKST